MEHICPILDQCMSALTGHVIKWDHSFELPKYLMKLDGVMSFAALFTIVNEFEQIHLFLQNLSPIFGQGWRLW